MDGNASLMPLMRAQMEAEFGLAHNRWPPWRTDTPPAPGHYLTSVDTGDSIYVRIDLWDGAWVTRGGYSTITGWQDLPAA